MLLSLNFWLGWLCIVLAVIAIPNVHSVWSGLFVALGFLIGIANLYFAWRTEA